MESRSFANASEDVKIYYQIGDMETEAQVMRVLSRYSPHDQTFSSIEVRLSQPEEDLPHLVDELRSHINPQRDSLILLYCCSGEDLIYDLGVQMKIEYS